MAEDTGKTKEQLVTELEEARRRIAELEAPRAQRNQVEDASGQPNIVYSVLVEKGSDGVIVLQDGVVKFANAKASELTGLSQKDLIGKPWIDFVSPRYRDLTKERFGRRVSGENVPSKYEIEIVNSNGSVTSVEINAALMDYHGEPAVLSMVRDITERKKAEEQLRTAEQNFQNSIDESPLGILIDTVDNEHLYANRALLDIYGFNSVDEFDSIPASKRLTPESLAVHQERLTLRKQGKTVPSNYEISIVRKDGGIRHLSASRKELQWNGRTQLQVVFQDITERKQAQEEMRRANEKLSLLVNKLEVQNRLNNILSEMRDMLQICSSVKETAPVVSSSANKIFPGTQGALFLMSESKTDLEAVARWGDFPKGLDENVFSPEDCWGLRTGRPHVVGDVGSGPVCAHVTQSPAGGYMCLPLTANGNVIGLLHIRDGNPAGRGSAQSLLGLSDIAISLSEQLSLAMSNVKLTETLSYQSVRDPLSGLFNRRYMEESLLREIARAERKKTQIGVIMADLDHLKIFNDSYGHAAGDLLISQVGRVFRNGIRSSDIACRYGGEEFIIILSESSLDDTLKRASALKESVKKTEPLFHGQPLDRVTVSMGVAAYPQHGATVSDLLRAADTALYRAKQGGRDRVVASG